MTQSQVMARSGKRSWGEEEEAIMEQLDDDSVGCSSGWPRYWLRGAWRRSRREVLDDGALPPARRKERKEEGNEASVGNHVFGSTLISLCRT
jgi:hypothetical protein